MGRSGLIAPRVSWFIERARTGGIVWLYCNLLYMQRAGSMARCPTLITPERVPGHVQVVRVPGREVELHTISRDPLLIRIPNLLNATEVESLWKLFDADDTVNERYSSTFGDEYDEKGESLSPNNEAEMEEDLEIRDSLQKDLQPHEVWAPRHCLHSAHTPACPG